MYYDSCNKLQHKLTIYRLHYKNAYLDEKESKRRDRKENKIKKNKKLEKVLKIKKKLNLENEDERNNKRKNDK